MGNYPNGNPQINRDTCISNKDISFYAKMQIFSLEIEISLFKMQRYLYLPWNKDIANLSTDISNLNADISILNTDIYI